VAATVPLLTAVAMLSVACTAGYGILHPRTGPTLQQQIAKGVRVSALTWNGPAQSAIRPGSPIRGGSSLAACRSARLSIAEYNSQTSSRRNRCA
jgi:hypothetical protein